jgi:hypothetical protein
MHKYTYCLDGVKHTIKSQEPIPTADENGIIPISSQQNKVACQLKQLLREWIRLAYEHNIDWFCNGGTLLGAIRDKGLIHYDNDLDLVVFLKDFHKIKNMSCGPNVEIDYCEQGFQLHFKDKMFPFIDLWVEAPNPNNPEQIILTCPIRDDGTPTYGGNMIWPHDNFNVKDVTTFVKVPFEDLLVNVPHNSEQYLRKMYGDDCFTRYVIYNHTDDHSMVDLLPHPKIRMKILNKLIKLENKPTVASTITALCGTLITNEFATSDSGKIKRHLDIITRHIGERYFGVKSPFGV